MPQPPARRPQTGIEPAPERRLTTTEFEQVIRRAAELQAKSAEQGGDDGMPEGEIIRIGRELGLTTQHLNRALAEVKGSTPTETGVLVRAFGEALVTAARTVPGDADAVRARLERYLLDWEYLTVKRRLRDRTVYTRASGLAASLGRASSQLMRRSPLLKLSELEVSVQPLEEGFCHVTLASNLAGQRAGVAAGTALAGGGAGTAIGVVFGIAVNPALGLLGVPVLVGAWAGFRAAYQHSANTATTQLEALLDRLEHGELPR